MDGFAYEYHQDHKEVFGPGVAIPALMRIKMLQIYIALDALWSGKVQRRIPAGLRHAGSRPCAQPGDPWTSHHSPCRAVPGIRCRGRLGGGGRGGGPAAGVPPAAAKDYRKHCFQNTVFKTLFLKH